MDQQSVPCLAFVFLSTPLWQVAGIGQLLIGLQTMLRSAAAILHRACMLFSPTKPVGPFLRQSKHKPRCKHQHQHHLCKPAWVQRDILSLKALLPAGSGVRQIAALFNRIQQAKPQTPNCPIQKVSKSHVANVLRSHAAQALRLREQIRQRQAGISPILHTWGIDLTGKQDTQGQLHHILGILDHGSRKLIALLVSSKHSTALLAHILRNTAQAGAPKHIRTDNERCFTSPAFSQALQQLGIHHQTTELHCPWQNGRIERLFGTLKQQLNQIHIHSAEHLQNLLDEFKHWYNHIRLHQHLSYQTPHEVWQQQLPSQAASKANPSAQHTSQATRLTWWTGWGGMLSGLQLQPIQTRRRSER